MGFGPFRWVCTSGKPEDLKLTDKIAGEIIDRLAKEDGILSVSYCHPRLVPPSVRQQYEDNRRWIKQADEHRLVVGSQARILYSDQAGRIAIALAFNAAVGSGQLTVYGISAGL